MARKMVDRCLVTVFETNLEKSVYDTLNYIDIVYEKSMAIVGTKEVARLLGVSIVRVRHLLAQKRIKGAKKKGKFWQIPLKKGMPVITKGKRGPKPKWNNRPPSRAKKIIHVNRNKIESNKNHNLKQSVISIKQGKKNTYANKVQLEGKSIIIYRPHRPLHCGATLWIETREQVTILA